MKRMKKFVCIVLICILLLGVTNIAQAAEPDAEVQMVIDLIAALPDEITLADEATVAAIGELYEELPAEKQQQVSNLAVLQAAQARIEQLFSAGVAAVDALIAALPQTITLTDEQTIAAAANAYEALTDAQKQAVADHARLAAAQTAIAGLKQEAADAVIAQIEALGTDITPEDAQQVADARAAYDALAPEIRALITNVQKLLDAEAALAAQTPTTLKTKEEIAEILQDLAGQMKSTITDPTVGTVGGEWTVFCLARWGAADEDYENIYLNNLYQYAEDRSGVLHTQKYTEYSRVILALGVIGHEGYDVAGYDLIAPLADFNKVKEQGINGPIWALIALDSRSYPVPQLPEGSIKTQTTRENLIDCILSHEIPGGGWALSGSVPDPDVTGMALQALAPYRERTDVSSAIERALAVLGSLQREDGSYASWGTVNTESIAQVIVALNTLGIPLDDARFVKNGNNLLDALLRFYDPAAKAFCHTASGGADAMATDQGMYALISCYRALAGQTSLYDLSDVPLRGSSAEPEEVTAIIAAVGALPASLTLDHESTVNSLWVQLLQMGEFPQKESLKEKLQAAKDELSAQRSAVKALDNDIWNQIDPLCVTQQDAQTVSALMQRYYVLSEANRRYLVHAQDLLDANSIQQAFRAGTIPARVFSNMLNSRQSFVYQAEGYTLSFDAGTVRAAWDVDTHIDPAVRDPKAAGALRQAAAASFHVAQTDFPAEVRIGLTMDVQDGEYILYGLDPKTKKIYKVGSVTVDGTRMTFTTAVGGDFYLVPAAQVDASGKLFRPLMNAHNGPVEQNVFEEIMGQDINLKIEGITDLGDEYTLIFNGEFITNPMEFDPVLTRTTDQEKYIRRLAENPFILHIPDELPGKMLVQIKTPLQDGQYLLFLYDPQQMRAEFVQKVTVADGVAEFFIDRGGDYFMDVRAKASSLMENTDITPEVQAAEVPEEEIPVQNTVPVLPWWAIVLIAAGLAGVVVFWRIKNRKGEAHE